jgi:4-amino-4-deoxychorismate lyase
MMLVNSQAGDTISVHDRGLHFGDGVFETIAIRHGKLSLLWERHMARLYGGCERLGISAPRKTLLLDEAKRVCGSMDDGVLKIIITRGAAGRGYRAPVAAEPTRILISYPWPDYPASNREQGIIVRRCVTQLGHRPTLAGIKHLNRLEQVLARSEWHNDDIAEGLMLDDHGNVIEGTMTNLFVVQDGRLVTPDVSQCGIAGVMREHIIDVAWQHGAACHITTLSPADVKQADEVFVCNSLVGIWPVRRFEEIRYSDWPMTGKIIRWLAT